MGAPISLDGIAVHPHCWCICPCYLHFAPENPEDGDKHTIFDLYHRSWGNLAGMQHSPVIGHRVMLNLMTQGLMDCRKAGDFRSVPGILTH